MRRTTGFGSLHLLTAAGTGALLMYLFDPQQGRRRVAMARDRLVHLGESASDALDVGRRDLSNRGAGLMAEMRGRLHRAPPADEVLAQRVRTALGRLSSHPRAVMVTAASGRVTLGGQVLREEEEQLLRGVQAVRGVREVDNQLEVHERAGAIPSLQGGRAAGGPRTEFMQGNWAAGPRLLAFGAGAALAVYGLARRGLVGHLLGMTGVAAAACAASGHTRGSALGRSGHRAIDIRKTIHIAAPPERVFDLWSDCENFPRFMSNVEEVRRLDGGRTHWVVKGPAGTRLEWDAVFTEQVRPELLAWRSEPQAPVRHAGTVRFEADGDGTRVMVQMCYEPPGGALGHSVAALLGRDPKQDLDADLMWMKSFVETGVPPRDAARPDPATTGTPAGTATH